MSDNFFKIMCLLLMFILTGVLGFGIAESEKLQDRLKHMEVSVAVCGDVAAYFAPNDELTSGMELSKPEKKK